MAVFFDLFFSTYLKIEEVSILDTSSLSKNSLLLNNNNNNNPSQAIFTPLKVSFISYHAYEINYSNLFWLTNLIDVLTKPD